MTSASPATLSSLVFINAGVSGPQHRPLSGEQGRAQLAHPRLRGERREGPADCGAHHASRLGEDRDGRSRGPALRAPARASSRRCKVARRLRA